MNGTETLFLAAVGLLFLGLRRRNAAASSAPPAPPAPYYITGGLLNDLPPAVNGGRDQPVGNEPPPRRSRSASGTGPGGLVPPSGGDGGQNFDPGLAPPSGGDGGGTGSLLGTRVGRLPDGYVQPVLTNAYGVPAAPAGRATGDAPAPVLAPAKTGYQKLRTGDAPANGSNLWAPSPSVTNTRIN